MMVSKKNNLARIYFFYGEESFLAEERIEAIRSTFLAEEKEGAFFRFSPEETSWIEIIESLRTGDLFHPGRKLVLVSVPEGMENSLTKEEENLWRDYLASPRPEVVLIVYYSGRLDKNSKLYQLFQSGRSSHFKEEEFKSLKVHELKNWIKARLEKQGKRISSEALEVLLDAVGNDLRILSKELDKLCLYSYQTKNIDLEDVAALCPSVRSVREYELVESLETGSASKAFQVMSKLLDEASEPEKVVGAIANFFKDLLLAREWLDQGQTEEAVFHKLRPWIKESYGGFYRNKIKQFRSAVFSLSEADLKEALAKLHSIDQAIKSGAKEQSDILIDEFLGWYFERRRNKNSGSINWLGQ